MLALEKQIAIVTGASGGIGGAIASALSQAGAHVIAMGRDNAGLQKLIRRFHAFPGTAEAFRADLTQDDDLSGFADYVFSTFGRLDILVHSAGAYARKNSSSLPLTLWTHSTPQNVRGPYLLTKKLLPALKQPRGQIVFINSSAALSPRPEVGQYSATQHAFKALADGLRNEIDADQVRVLSVYLGRTAQLASVP